MLALRILILTIAFLIGGIPQTAGAVSLKYRLAPVALKDIFYYVEEAVGQGDRLYGPLDPAVHVTGFIILDFRNFDWESYPDGFFSPDVKRYSFTNGVRTFNHKNSYVDIFRTKFGPSMELEEFDIWLDEKVPPGDWSTLSMTNHYLETEFRYLFLPKDPDDCYHGEFELCTEYSSATGSTAATWTVSAVPTPGALGALSTSLLAFGTLVRRRRCSQGSDRG